MTWSQDNTTLMLKVVCSEHEIKLTGIIDVEQGLTIKTCKVKLAEQVGLKFIVNIALFLVKKNDCSL